MSRGEGMLILGEIIMKVLIIGNGVAGISVAQDLRSREPSRDKLEISVLARESYDYYARIRLPEVFGAEGVSAEAISLHKPSWYMDRAIDVSLSREAVAIDRASSRVILATGEDLGYDALVLALGSDAARPALPGLCLPGVCAVREFDDAARLRALTLAHPEAVAVIGGGLLGLEAAHHLQLLGAKRVAVLEIAPRLLPRQLDGGGAALLERSLAGMGLEIVTGAAVRAFVGRDRLEGITYSAGGEERTLEAGTALVSMGVRPRIGLAKAAGLATGRGILVDRFLRTSDPSVFAVGDCAEFNGAVLGIIPAALEQAPSCAAAILGDESRPYAGTICSSTLKIASIDAFSAGIVDRPAGEDVEELVFEPGAGRYERYLLKGGLLAGAIVIGSKERARAAKARMGAPAAESELAPA
jgi:NAD(P)H-nitrite reductase large subunit